MPKKLRAAVVGVGHMGRHHARIYSELPETELVAVVDKDLSQAEKYAKMYGCKACREVGDIVSEVDVASIAVPTVVHAAATHPLVEARIPVLIEKPLAPDVATAQQILTWARQYDTVIQVGHSERFNPVVQAMKRMEVTPKFIETNRISPFTFRSADVGVVFDMMIHDIDIVLHMVQDRSYQVNAVGVNVLGDCEDIANARVQFANGSVVNMTASRLALKTERRIRVFCPDAYLSMDYQKRTGIAVKKDANLDLLKMARERNYEDLSQMKNVDFGSLVNVEPLVIEDTEPLRMEIESFLRAARDQDSSGVSVEEGAAAVSLAQEIVDCINACGWHDGV
ncbi:MAG: Gfo/Idh/MocA family oxidoreductase [Phycisphaerae bacterium]|nr:Gfo/Idh/MocA family oxidoreductase [Phycisphaerae bacterium]